MNIKGLLYKIDNEPLNRFACKALLYSKAFAKGLKLNFKKETVEIIKGKTKIIISSSSLVYANDIINDYNYYFDDVIPEKIGEYDVVDFSQPKKHTFKKSGLSFYFSSFVETDDLAAEYTQEYEIKPGDVVFDCGAYCGTTAYFFSKMVGETGMVYAFEPDDKNYAMLLKNIELHNLKNVIPVKKGLWSKTGVLEFNQEGNLGGAIEEITKRPFNKNVTTIDTMSLKDAYEQFQLSKLNFVKMDIEGAELEAIEGSKEFIKDKNINFSIASYHVVNNELTYIKLEKYFSEIGYKYKTIGLENKNTLGNIITYAWKNEN